LRLDVLDALVIAAKAHAPSGLDRAWWRGLEQSGIKCVAITDEFAGGDGGSQSLADAAVEADAVVSTGNANERIVLPAMTATIGPLPDVVRVAGGYPGSVRDDGSIEVVTAPEDYVAVKQSMTEAGLEPEESDLTMRASTNADLGVDEAQKVLRLVDLLESSDDVQEVYYNAEIPEAAYEAQA